ncbi:MAG: tRNA pseudouridine(38-40) synthase TruA [Planctomycetota bacterium]
MARFRLDLCYDGTDFCGWSVQPGQRSVQGVLDEAREKGFGPQPDAFECTAAGRTDAGVHAQGQTVHLDVTGDVPPMELQKRLNALLPEDVKITGCRVAPDDFHARFQCLAKEYVYRVANTPVAPVLERRFVHFERRRVELAPLREAAAHLEGEHDFRGFTNSGRDTEGSVRLIHRVRVRRREGELEFMFLGKGFLYNQVRVMVGTLLDIGLGKKPPTLINEILRSGDRTMAGDTVPAKGLMLTRTIYAGDKQEVRIT